MKFLMENPATYPTKNHKIGGKNDNLTKILKLQIFQKLAFLKRLTTPNSY